MPKKHTDPKKLKNMQLGASTSSPQKSPAGTPPPNVKPSKEMPLKPLEPSVGFADNRKLKKKTSIVRRMLSLSIIGYLGYYFFYGCGSPFNVIEEKPAICEPIDTLKLDLYSLLESSYFKTNINPYVIAPIRNHYQQYGAPIQKKTQALYQAYGIKGRQFIHQTMAPKVNELLGKPIVQDRTKQAHKIYNDQLSPLFQRIQEHYQVAQNTVIEKYHDLPPFILERTEKIRDLYQQAENTEMKPILIGYYWTIIDFCRNQFVPLVFHNSYAEQVRTYVNENAKVKAYLQQPNIYYQQYVQPYAVQFYRRYHLDKLFYHLLSLLPQRPTNPKETVGSSIIETKTPEKAHKTIDIPITSSYSKVTDVVKEKVSQITKPASATPLQPPVLSKASDSIKEKLESASSSVASATKVFDSLKDKIKNIHPTIPAFHVKNQENDHIKESTKSIESTEPVVVFDHVVIAEKKDVQEEKEPIEINKEEVLIENVKQEEKEVENEEILAEIKQEKEDKNAPVIEKEKEMVTVPDEKELFEVHKKEPQSPLVQEDSKEAPIILDDVIILEDQVIIPPVSAAAKASPEEPIDAEEEVILL